MQRLVKSMESPSLHFTIHHAAPQGDVWSIRCGPTLVLIRRLEMIFLHIANALNTLGRCNALPRYGMPRQTWVMSILNALLTEESHFVRLRWTSLFPTKFFDYCLQSAPSFLDPGPAWRPQTKIWNQNEKSETWIPRCVKCFFNKMS